MPLFVQPCCERLHEALDVEQQSLGFFIGILATCMCRVVPPRVLDNHEVSRSLREELLLIFPVGRARWISGHVAYGFLDALNYVVPLGMVARNAEACTQHPKSEEHTSELQSLR